MFNKILIANRGEIAVRIVRACHELGVRAVVAYSEADRYSLAVRMADEAVCIGPAPSPRSYLNQSALISAARITGCEAIHPGYGFLSENAYFAEICAQYGIKFIGPTPEAIRLMGDKAEGRNTMKAAGVPIVPGSTGELSSLEEAVELAREIGYPILLKPAGGGGGIGMLPAKDEAELLTAVERSRSMASRGFGTAEVYLEKLIERPRHVEFQILGDRHGSAMHLFERDCSTQRRNQKVIEEAPGPLIPRDQALGVADQIAGIMQSMGYDNIGTVEMLLGADGSFNFLEMNTRLQVEHPVTEQITGLDLVREQLRIAAGEPLGYTQAQLRTHGHAIEYRVYAEDPAAGYLPTTGPLLAHRPPVGEGVRVDAGVAEGQVVSAAFDPMLAKLVVTGATREQARARADAALAGYVLLGCRSNLDFLRRLNGHPAFAAGQIHTGFLDAHPEVAVEPPPAPGTLLRLLAAGALASRPLREAADAVPPMHAAMGAWRN